MVDLPETVMVEGIDEAEGLLGETPLEPEAVLVLFDTQVAMDDAGTIMSTAASTTSASSQKRRADKVMTLEA